MVQGTLLRVDVGMTSPLAEFIASGDASVEERLQRAVAWGTAACRFPGAKMPRPGDVIVEEVNVDATPNLAMALVVER